MRTFNFSAGPSALPTEVLERAQSELLDYHGTGMSVMEMSHRSSIYEEVHDAAIANLRGLMGIPDEYDVIFMGGGARTQFALVPYNLSVPGSPSEYITTGTWSEGALREARKLGDANEIWTGLEEKYTRVPGAGDYTPNDNAAYLHYTSNNTIYGTQFHHVPIAPTVVCDMSSDILSRPVDVSKFGLIYAGAQKNMGPSGVTVVIIRPDLLERCRAEMPELWSYQKIAGKNSMLNTPPTFPIYLLRLVTDWVRENGGVQVMGERNHLKAQRLYDLMDNEFYVPHAHADSRSRMNVTFRLSNENLERLFLEACEARKIVGVRGHRSVGGVRASIYNAVPAAAVEALAELMGEFRDSHG